VKKLAFGIWSAVCAVLLTVALAQQPACAQAGPVPPAILAAKKIFVSNTAPVNSVYSGGPDRFYNQFYTSLKSTGKFEMVTDPSDADLVLETQLDQLVNLKLVIYDRKSHYVLWSLTEFGSGSPFQGLRDRGFDKAVAALVQDFETLAGKAPAAAHR